MQVEGTRSLGATGDVLWSGASWGACSSMSDPANQRRETNKGGVFAPDSGVIGAGLVDGPSLYPFLGRRLQKVQQNQKH